MTEPPLQYVANVSWPRSGHHLIERFLNAYFGKRHRYCNPYALSPQCCRALPSSPCRHQATVTFSKNHGEDTRSVAPGDRHLITFRHFLPAFVSIYGPTLKFDGIRDSPAVFRNMLWERAHLYKAWCETWVFAGEDLEKMLVRYEDLTAWPQQNFAAIIRYCSPRETVDEARVAALVAGLGSENRDQDGMVRDFSGEPGIRDRRDITRFQHYDHGLFAEVESFLRATLERANLPLHFSPPAPLPEEP